VVDVVMHQLDTVNPSAAGQVVAKTSSALAGLVFVGQRLKVDGFLLIVEAATRLLALIGVQHRPIHGAISTLPLPD
jgi:hypothetical protein